MSAPAVPGQEAAASGTDSAARPTSPIEEAVHAALASVDDPEIRRPITDLGMVRSAVVAADGTVRVELLLTVAGCPLRDKLRTDITAAVGAVPGVTGVSIDFGVMSPEQRQQLQSRLRGGGQSQEPVIPFAQPGSRTRVYAVASGKGGVGKSSVTVNLAASLAAKGLSVGVVDADIYGHSVPRMLGVEGRPTRVEDMIMPPQAHGVKVISIGMFTDGNAAVVWRGPMLHRALQQFLADVYWGDLDVLLLDLPPGTGDVAISLAQLLPNAEILVVTTPQTAAAEVAERAGGIALQTHQRLVGVVENMSWLDLPDGSRMEVFGSGGGATVAASLTRVIGAQVPLLGQIPLDTRVREAGDAGDPVVLAEPEAPAARALSAVADRLAVRRESLLGKPLGLRPAGR
ncbi:Mrp/NBP35 family ATP-binding protein [Micromonospora sp. WMMD1102]|uniref:Mrp/NBP35 family ATP-binding protein n=1 Tax=Micromonospora sp. WMMD1102 TaxID=3016105 RepID=UPI002414D7BE|nr:Mrp/NBP35 family ATP-binding protein [Micromonospora sp. WMMD1102]MDG4791687.1 Mrp/NBP35 family ATP-binding protein [Micromonospora sp. WMMD1102]